VEAHSEHPLAAAIVRGAAERGIVNEVEAGVEPRHKNNCVRELRDQGLVVAMA
jgi:cation transport ATPase